MAGLRARIRAGDRLTGTFVRTPSHETVEVLARAGFDFLCVDGEHGAIDRGRADALLAVGRALGVPMLMRVATGAPEHILAALDSGAEGVVVPHVRSAAEAGAVARWARFGRGGRGFAGYTRWAGFGSVPMAEALARSQDETVVLAQIEDAEALDALEAIAGTEGIDALFLGPGDLSIALGKTDVSSPELAAARAAIGRAARGAGKGFATFVPGAAAAAASLADGANLLFVGSDQGLMVDGARRALEALRDA
jgi:2-keto-3-deoxy-L-rhamnonate aldolase RhmA